VIGWSAATIEPVGATVLVPHRRVPVVGRFARCTRCGTTLRPATIRHEQTLVFASCCPYCDGALTDAAASSGPAGQGVESSVFLG